MNWKALTTGPAALAVLLTVGNAVKPPVVDDTAYLLFARHLSIAPLDPYGWELFWYSQPEPAMAILLPPVLPYYLAAGIRLFGEQPTLLKFWLFPVCYLFTRSAWVLFARFALGWERPGTTLATLGSAMLPMVNFMLDVPAVALGLAALVAFIRGCDGAARRSGCAGHGDLPSPAQPDLRWIALAGLLAGLAMQTKYTTLTLPAVFAAYALTRRRLLPAILATGVAIGLFAAWEGYLVHIYGVSHFLEQVRDQADGDFWAKLDKKGALVRPLAVQLGGLATAWGLLAARSLGVTLQVLAAVVALQVGGFILLLHTQPGLVYLPAGYTTLVLAVAVGWRLRGSADGRFLAAWFLVELLGYFALTPFPACRRVIPTVLALGFLVGRAVTPLPTRCLVAFGVACGVGLLALDVWDARVEPAGVVASSKVIGDPGRHAVWTQGHWGWQYAADRCGWKLVEPGRTKMAAGDFLVWPVEPDPFGFYRPWHSGAKVTPDPDVLQQLGEWEWEDRLPYQTVPNLYGGTYPVIVRDYPRLRLRVYRVVRDWTPPIAGTL